MAEQSGGTAKSYPLCCERQKNPNRPGAPEAQETVVRILAALLAVILIAWPQTSASGKQARGRSHAVGYSPYIPRDPGYPYPHARRPYPYDSSRLPFGSGEWWRQMLREDRVRN